MESSDFENFYEPKIDQINDLFSEKSGQFMIVSPDLSILDCAICKLKKIQKYKFVEVKRDKDQCPDNKVFIIRLSSTVSMEYQSLLYYYFELPLHYDCFICIVTNSSNALNLFEKRVMSRFKNRIFFFPYYTANTKKLDNEMATLSTANTNKLDSEMLTLSTADTKIIIHSSMLAQKQDLIMKKYDLEPYSLPFILDLFEPIHIALIMISFSTRINLIKVHDQFKLAVLNTPELKKAKSIRVLQCAFDVIESGCVNEKGFPMIDFNEFKGFVNEKCPLYLKTLLRSLALIKK